MATPKEALTGNVAQSININSQAKAAPPNKPMANTDTVQFTNNDPVDSAMVTFEGAGAGIFTLNGQPVTAVTVSANGGVSGQLTPTQSNLTVNYLVSAGANDDGAFSIEIGTGPLEIDIVDTDGDTNLESAAIANNGTLFFKNETGENATITFGGDKDVLYDSNGNAVTSQKVNNNSSGGLLTGKGSNKRVTYGVAMSVTEPGRVGTGGGSIKVGQT
jgi:hypothetical protein